MAYVIGNDCVACGTCIDECPVGAISAGDDKYSINPDMCTECGTAQVSARARLSAFRKGHAKREKGLPWQSFFLCSAGDELFPLFMNITS